MFALLLALATSTSAQAATSVNTYSISQSYRNPASTTVTDGALWYIESSPTYPYNNYYIGKMTTSGVTTDYTVGYPGGSNNFVIRSLTTGQDGNVWFNGKDNNNTLYVGSLNISTGAIAFYPYSMPTYSLPSNLVRNTDGTLWYSVKSAYSNGYSYIVYFNPSTSTTTVSKVLDGYADVTGITSHPDGSIWFTDSYYNRVQYIVPSTNTSNSYVVPTVNSQPGGIIFGNDDSLWFIENASGKIAKLTTSGIFTEYVPSSGISAYTLAAGSDGMIWFTDTVHNKIGRITTTGTISTYDVPSGVSGIGKITTGPDGSLWFTASSNNGALVRLIVNPDFTAYPISSSYRKPGSTTVAGGDLWYIQSSPTYPYNNYYIGRMTTLGITSNYLVGYPAGSSNFIVRSLTTGQDGNVWFNGKDNNNTLYVGSLNISTGAIAFYPYSMPTYSPPGNLTLGSDGNLWYSVKSAYSNNYSYIVYFNPSNSTTSIGKTLDSYADVSSLTSGIDGNLWFTNSYYNRVQYIIPSSGGGGSYTIPTTNSQPGGIVSGKDNNLWLIENTNGKIAKLTTSGVFTEYTLPAGVSAYMLTTDSDGMLWFTDTIHSKIGRITPTGIVTIYSAPTGISGIEKIITGPGNTLWFTSSSNNGALVKLVY